MRELIFNILQQGYLPSYFTLQSFFSPDTWNYVKLGILVEDMF